jgi:hypothetical protein
MYMYLYRQWVRYPNPGVPRPQILTSERLGFMNIHVRPSLGLSTIITLQHHLIFRGFATGTAVRQLTYMAQACHNCRRQRLNCDTTRPHCQKCAKRGQQCLGYQRLLRWETSTGIRGNIGDVTFNGKIANKFRPAKWQESPLRALTDPLMQDMGLKERSYLSYCML